MAETSTVERAYALARTGEFAGLPELKARLVREGCRAVEPLLAGRSLQGHLRAICQATYKKPGEEEQ